MGFWGFGVHWGLEERERLLGAPPVGRLSNGPVPHARRLDGPG